MDDLFLSGRASDREGPVSWSVRLGHADYLPILFDWNSSKLWLQRVYFVEYRDFALLCVLFRVKEGGNASGRKRATGCTCVSFRHTNILQFFLYADGNRFNDIFKDVSTSTSSVSLRSDSRQRDNN